MRPRTIALTLSVLMACTLAVVSAETPIKVAQIMRLISARTPDAVIAAEVASRGVAEVIDRKMIESVRAAGAGPATLAALERIRPKSNIAINGLPGTQVSLDGRVAGRIDDAGTLTLRDVPPGRHEIAATLWEHTPQSRTISLATRQNLDVELRLTSIYGLLSVTTNAADATVEIDGVSGNRGDLARRRLSTGRHVVKVQAPLRQPYTETIDVKGGEAIERRLTLAPDPAQLSTALQRIAERMQQRDYRSAQNLATNYLQVAEDATPPPPGVVSALVYLADAQLHLRDQTKALPTTRRALEAGGRFTLQVVHHHSIAPPIHAATLTVTATELAYEPSGPCTFSKGLIPVARLQVSETTVRTQQRQYRAVQIKFPKPNKPSDEATMNFLEAGDSPLDILATVLRAARTSQLRIAPTPPPAPGTPPAAGIAGRYVRQNSNDYVELRPDGTFFVLQGGSTASGTYTVSGDVLTIRANGKTDTGRISGNTIIDSSGWVWVKVP